MENLQAVKQRYGIMGRSAALERALSTALRVANTDLSVLITGESGVGKEIFSRVIHDNSARKHNNFIAINCGAIPEGTINSELFGHEKGAFTGATGERKGYFETYDGGTIFLDEIGEMPLDTQAFLLRILETGEFIRVGSSKSLKTDVRIVAATNVVLEEKMKRGRFREDLFYRLSTVPISIPPLRERREDIYLLFRKFAVDFAEKYRIEPVQLDDQSRMLVENYAWPGNIRELKNAAEQISVLADQRLLDAEGLIRLLPNIVNRNLPMIREDNGAGGNMSMQEREILYKLLFDLKNDMNDLKAVVRDLIRNNDLRIPDSADFRSLQPSGQSLAPVPHKPPAKPFSNNDFGDLYEPSGKATSPDFGRQDDQNDRAIILDHNSSHYGNSEVVEENLSLEDNEKDLIRKALRKHSGRRKEAADDLGISERTLYRKIKEYDLQ